MQQSSALVAERRDALKDNPTSAKGSEATCMIYSICYVSLLPFLRITGDSFSKCITERMMRNED